MAMLPVRQIDQVDKGWLQSEAERRHLSVEELVRRMIRDERQRSLRRRKPSEIVGRYLGPNASVDLGERARFDFEARDLPDIAGLDDR